MQYTLYIPGFETNLKLLIRNCLVFGEFSLNLCNVAYLADEMN